MPVVFSQLEDLANALSEKVGNSGIVGIDGWTGVGKTTLAMDLARELGAAFFDLDCALIHDQGEYVLALRMSEISIALAKRHRPLMLSGVCLFEVLAQLGTRPDASVYVKRMAKWGWADEDEVTGLVFEVPGAGGNAIRHEMRLYHQKWQPHLDADFEFQRAG